MRPATGVGTRRIAEGGLMRSAHDFRQSEVEYFGLLAIGDENIGRLDVAVNDALGVSGIEGVGNLLAEFEETLEIEAAARDRVLERFAFQAFHRNESPAVL